MARTAEQKKARDGWLLSLPALTLLILAASGPLIIIAIYAFLTAGE